MIFLESKRIPIEFSKKKKKNFIIFDNSYCYKLEEKKKKKKETKVARSMIQNPFCC
jgi:hypothetical protein